MYVTADLHFNHRGILDYTNRPWTTVEEMNAGLIENWNYVVPPRADIWVLGDFGFDNRYGEPLIDIFNQLNGRKHLIVGNHDEKNKQCMALPWERVEQIHRLRCENKQRAVLCHYPLETWPGAGRTIHLHGHSHGNLQRVIPHRFDVGIDAWGNLFPRPIAVYFQAAANQTFEPQDHHGGER